VPQRPPTHIGDGKQAIVLEEFLRQWPGLEVTFRSDDIRRPTDWRIHDRRHAIVVHLGGHMQRLETELDGFGGSCGPASPGEVWTAPAERNYSSHACGTTIHYALMFLQPDAADTLQGTKRGRRELVPLAGVRDEFLHQATRKLMAAARRTDDASEMLAESLAQSIGLYLCQTYGPEQTGPLARPQNDPTLNATTARQLREFIYDRLCERISLADLSQLAGMTTHQLLIAFRKSFGCTPAQYIIQQRLRCAQRQLATTPKDITRIALESGFSSHSHLTACFQKHLGYCPSAFRAVETTRTKVVQRGVARSES